MGSQIALCLFTFISIAGINSLYGQENLDSLYEDSSWRAEQAYLYQRYIPVDEKDAFQELERLGNKKGLEKFKNAPEDSIRRRLHFGLGGWMMQNWQLYKGSRLSYYLNRRGLTFPDDIVEYLIISFHRHLNDKPLNSEALIDSFIEQRKKEYQTRIDSAKKLDTLIYDRQEKKFRKKNSDAE